MSQRDRAIQTFALNFCFTPIALVLSHMHQVPLILQTNALGWLVSEVSLKHWDLGSIPRSPPFSISFCLMCSYAACILRSTIQLHALACHMSQETNLKARMRGPSCIHHLGAPHVSCDESEDQDLESTMDISQMLLTQSQKSQKRPPPDGLKFLNLPPKLGSTPPIGLHSIFFLFIFSI